MPSQQTNPDLTLGNVRPGVYVGVNLDAPGGGVGDVSRRLLIVGYKQSSGAYPQDSPVQPLSQSDVIAGAGAKSDLARGYRAALAEVGAGDIDVFVLPLVEPSGGTASTYKLIVSFLASGTAALAPGSIDLLIDGRAILTVGFSTGDTGPVIAANLKAAIDALTDAPCTAGISSSTITLTYPHKGAVGEDLPIRGVVNEPNGAGSTAVTLSPGFVSFATNATGVGSVQAVVGATTVTVPLAGGETPAQVVTLLAAAFGAGSYPVTAAVDASITTQLNFFFAPGRDVRRIAVSVISSTGLTPTMSVGTIGSGSPSLTAGLTNLQPLLGFKDWAVPFVGTQSSVDTTSLGTIAAEIERRANGVYQQEQSVHACAPWTSSTLGTLPIGTSPALTTSPRYAILWAQDVGVQGFEIACRVAAARAANDYPAKNWDGYQLHSSLTAPLRLTAVPSRPTGDVINIAMRSFFLTPIRVDESSNTLVIEKGTTTSNSSYLPLRDFSTIDQIAFWRLSLAQRLADKFSNVGGKRFSPPRTPNTISGDAVGTEAYLLAREWDALDLYDGADTFKKGFQSRFNAQNPSRIDLSFPMSPVIPVHQIGAVGNLVSPSA